MEGKTVSLDDTHVSTGLRKRNSWNEGLLSSLSIKNSLDKFSLYDLFPYVLATGLLVALSWPLLVWWTWEFTRPESYYAHAPLIPFMTGFMIWNRRDIIARVSRRTYLPALLLLIPALALLIISIKGEMRAVESFAFLATIWSIVLLVLGPSFFKAAAFPLLFLTFMAPLPAPLLNDSTLHLQVLSTALASKILSLTGFSNTCYGTIIHIDYFTMAVDVPCSGFKTLLALLTFNAFLAYSLDGPLYKRILLFAVCSPLALLINGVRIAFIGMVGECLGNHAARVFHDYSGLLTLSMGFVLLFTVARILGCRKFAGWDIF